MKTLKNITTAFLAHLLVFAIVFPLIIHFTHIFENHEHTFCGDVKTHLHEQKFDCDFTKFISTLFHFERVYRVSDANESSYLKIFFNYSSISSKRLSQSNLLRGPPPFQQYSLVNRIFC